MCCYVALETNDELKDLFKELETAVVELVQQLKIAPPELERYMQ